MKPVSLTNYPEIKQAIDWVYREREREHLVPPDFMGSAETCQRIQEIWSKYYEEAGYCDEEPLRTIKLRRMQSKCRLAAIQRLNPKLP